MRDLPLWWITSRATGIVGYLALTGAMVAGLASKARLGQRAASPLARLEWHKALSITGLVMVLAHVLTLLGSARNFSPTQLLVPGLMPYRPLWAAVGQVAFWALIVVAITGPMRARLGARTWTAIHMTGYAVFVAATVHGLMIGTDSGRTVMLAVYIAAAATVAALAARRLIAPPAPVRRSPRPTPETTSRQAESAAGSQTG